MKSIVLVVNTSTFFPRLIELARFLTKHNFIPVFFFDHYYPTIQADITVCKAEQMQFELNYTINLNDSSEKSLSDGNSGFAHKVIDYFTIRLKAYYNRAFISGIPTYYKLYNRFEKVFTQYDPVLTVLIADMAQHNTAIQIKVTQKFGKKALILPSFMASYKEPAEHHYNDYAHNASGFWAKVIEIFFSKWVLKHRDKKLLRIPVKDIFIKELFSLTPPDPWTVHSGKANALAVEGEAVKRSCIMEGIPENRVYVTGSISNDILYEISCKAVDEKFSLLRQYGITDTKPVLLSSVPPDMFYSRREFTVFKTYNEFLLYWVQTLCKQKNFNVILSLHPSVKESDFKYLEQYGCIVVNKPILNFIPLCDLFVSSMSSTIQWAIACGKPVINYDEYKYRYHDFDDVEGVLYTDSKKDFEKILQNFSDSKYLNYMTHIQKNYASSWGMLDGKSGSRILKLINELIPA
jgi:hypothetical protein